jgi:hypothetical protein
MGRADEALILRTILFSAGLQMLGFNEESINSDLIDTFVAGHIRQQFMYEAVEEICSNADLIAWWPQSNIFVPAELYHQDIAPIRTHSVQRLTTVLKRNTTLEGGIYDRMYEYIEAANSVNQKLLQFSNGRVLSSGDWDTLKSEIAALLMGITQLNEYQMIATMPNKSMIGNLAILARAPWE